MLLAIETFTLIQIYVGHLAQEIIVTFYFVSYHLTPFIPVLLYKTPREDRCVRFLHRNARHSKPLVGCSFVSCKGGPLSMAQGTLANLSSSAFIRTPPLFAEWIVHHLLTFPAGEVVTVLDPTAGEGDLLTPCQDIPGLRLYGVEISADRADIQRLAQVLSWMVE